MREGKLPEVPFAVLLLALAVHKRTVSLEVRRKQLAKKIAVEHGVPVDCRSNLVHETLGPYLVSAGKLPQEDLLPYLNQSAARGVRLGEVLLENEVVGAEELFKLLQQNLAKKLLDVFAWKDGAFGIVGEGPASDSPLKVRVPQLIVTGIIKCSPLSEVEAGVVPLVGRRLGLNPNSQFSLDEIRLSPAHAQAAMALRSGRRMDEIAVGTGLPFDELNRLLYALAVLGLVVTADSIPRRTAGSIPVQPAPPPPVPPAGEPASEPQTAAPDAGAMPSAEVAPAPATTPAGAGPQSADIAEERRNEIVQAYLSHRQQDAFDLLGLPEGATLPAIEEAYLAFAERFAPWRLPGPGLEPIAEKARALFLAGARAFAELGDNEQRSTLLLRRETLREERRRRPPGDAFGIKTDLLDSEAQFKKGQALMEAGRYREAILQLEFASDCDPQNGLYSAELAYCRFLGSPAASGQALGELQETLRREPDCGIALFYSGEIHRALGHRDEAEALLRRALKAMSPDRRPIQALKALAAERRR